jgi:hypothetical protein
MKLMSLFLITKHNLLLNLLRSNSSTIMKSNKLKRDPQTLRVFTRKRCKVKLKNMKIESTRCLTNMRITIMLLKKRKLPLNLICKT